MVSASVPSKRTWSDDARTWTLSMIGGRSGEDLFHDVTFDIRETEIPARVAVGQLFVVETKQVQDRRVEIMDVHFVLLCEVAVVVGRPIGDAPFHAATGHPHG